MAVRPYYVRLRGTGLKNKKGERNADWDEGRQFAFVDEKKGGEVLIGTKQGAVAVRVFMKDGTVRARVTTTQWQFPPHSENWHGEKKFVDEFEVRNSDQKIEIHDQLTMFGYGSTTCKCGAAITFMETVKGKNQPFDLKPIKSTILNNEGKAEVIDTFVPHHSTCPNVDEFRR